MFVRPNVLLDFWTVWTSLIHHLLTGSWCRYVGRRTIWQCNTLIAGIKSQKGWMFWIFHLPENFCVIIRLYMDLSVEFNKWMNEYACWITNNTDITYMRIEYRSDLVLLLISKKFGELCSCAVIPNEKWIFWVTVQQLQYLHFTSNKIMT